MLGHAGANACFFLLWLKIFGSTHVSCLSICQVITYFQLPPILTCLRLQTSQLSSAVNNHNRFTSQTTATTTRTLTRCQY